MMILGIETSCDETSAAVVESGRKIISNVILSQMEHETYGGVVPEIASRAHIQNLAPVVDRALEEAGIGIDRLDGIAVTRGPGLPGSLIVGLSFAKAMAGIKRLPLLAVNHLEAHLAANFIGDNPPQYPFLALLVSGGHTCLIHSRFQGDYRLLGATLDDAAGEAFDKISVFLGLGYPGGPAIEKAAKGGDPDFVRFPRGLMGRRGFDFSFSGLKTAVVVYTRKQGNDFVRKNIKEIAASFQQAVVEVLVEKTLDALLKYDVKSVLLAGGVAANSGLRRALGARLQERGRKFYYPPLELCTDNAAMVAALGYHCLSRGLTDDPHVGIEPRLSIGRDMP
ncbi:tRNA (adenosine(37)-N6)-threonylcarbamoyltransferase complex transferase subunit TsaD [candidate division KSB1 bacterium]